MSHYMTKHTDTITLFKAAATYYAVYAAMFALQHLGLVSSASFMSLSSKVAFVGVAAVFLLVWIVVSGFVYGRFTQKPLPGGIFPLTVVLCLPEIFRASRVGTLLMSVFLTFVLLLIGALAGQALRR